MRPYNIRNAGLLGSDCVVCLLKCHIIKKTIWARDKSEYNSIAPVLLIMTLVQFWLGPGEWCRRWLKWGTSLACLPRFTSSCVCVTDELAAHLLLNFHKALLEIGRIWWSEIKCGAYFASWRPEGVLSGSSDKHVDACVASGSGERLKIATWSSLVTFILSSHGIQKQTKQVSDTQCEAGSVGQLQPSAVQTKQKRKKALRTLLAWN